MSILFADISQFTDNTAHMSPADQIALLNRLVEAFDDAAARVGVEKVKTIGTGYMAASGLQGRASTMPSALSTLRSPCSALSTVMIAKATPRWAFGLGSMPGRLPPASWAGRNSSTTCGARQSIWPIGSRVRVMLAVSSFLIPSTNVCANSIPLPRRERSRPRTSRMLRSGNFSPVENRPHE
ncbi:MAG: adenylate/guanylate cyclase domain-containing protein [Anaerolineales bacterium]|nr:adenylate/guanylate cyclase domain-containing protein [Anaerolineales bacterium]